MPELPEVETVRRGLEKYIVGHVIDRVEIINQGPFQGDVRKVEGAEVIDVRRSGKGLIIDLNNKYSLAIHIKLTGQIVYRDKQTDSEPLSPKVGTLPNKFTHIIFHLDRGGVLYYNDQRRFGWIKVIKTSEISSLPFFKNMGPEPFGLGVGPELTLDLFKKILSKASTKIKPFIMDQTKIGGIGNIYANDVLFKAKIDPRRSAKSLTSGETEKLYDAIISVLDKSLKEGGASELTFVNILGQEGNYQNHTLIYGKTGKPCPRDDAGVIRRITLAGRGTFYCPMCQQ